MTDRQTDIQRDRRMYRYAYIHIAKRLDNNTHIHKTFRQTDKQTNIQADRQTEKQTDRQPKE